MALPILFQDIFYFFVIKFTLVLSTSSFLYGTTNVLSVNRYASMWPLLIFSQTDNKFVLPIKAIFDRARGVHQVKISHLFILTNYFWVN